MNVRQLGERVAHLVVNAPCETSPPSMWAMGMRSASATDAGASISYRSAISSRMSGAMRSARPQGQNGDADGLGHPVSVSELSRHSIRA